MVKVFLFKALFLNYYFMIMIIIIFNRQRFLCQVATEVSKPSIPVLSSLQMNAWSNKPPSFLARVFLTNKHLN